MTMKQVDNHRNKMQQLIICGYRSVIWEGVFQKKKNELVNTKRPIILITLVLKILISFFTSSSEILIYVCVHSNIHTQCI